MSRAQSKGLLRCFAMYYFLTYVRRVFLKLFTKVCIYLFGLLCLHFTLQQKAKNAILILFIKLFKKEGTDSLCDENTIIAP